MSTTVNTFSVLSESSQINTAGKPNASSLPIPKKNNLDINKSNIHVGKQEKILKPLNVININFQSIKNKKPELDVLITLYNQMQ